jgi:hypothetical protein
VRDVSWKKIQGQAFKKPDYEGLLSACVGMGSQALISITFLLFGLAVGILSPA